MKSLRKFIVSVGLLSTIFICLPATAQQKTPMPTLKPDVVQQEVEKLKTQVEVLKDRMSILSSSSKNLPDKSEISTGGIAILFGAFCALWAQNTRRNAFLWFFCGVFFNVIAVFVLLYKNSKTMRKNTRQQTSRAVPTPKATRP